MRLQIICEVTNMRSYKYAKLQICEVTNMRSYDEKLKDTVKRYKVAKIQSYDAVLFELRDFAA